MICTLRALADTAVDDTVRVFKTQFPTVTSPFPVMEGSEKFWRISRSDISQVSGKQRTVFQTKTNIQLHLKRGLLPARAFAI